MTVTRNQRNLGSLGGLLFAAFFFAGDILGGALAPIPLPLPGAPAAEVVRYYDASRTAVIAVGVLQMLAAGALLVFAGCVVAFVRRVRGEEETLPRLAVVGGVAAAVFLLICALLSLTLVPVAAGGNLSLVGALRQMSFLTGGALHVASLGLFVGAASIAARGAWALPGWIVWLGFVQGAVAILSLASLVLFPAALLILVGRMLGFIWCIAVGIALTFGTQREPNAGGSHHVLA